MLSKKRCKIGATFVLITNRKSHMSFRLVPNPMTLDDLERCICPNRRVISPNSVSFWADYVKVIEDTQILSAAECSPKNIVFSDISLMAILQGIASSESVKVRHSSLASEN